MAEGEFWKGVQEELGKQFVKALVEESTNPSLSSLSRWCHNGNGNACLETGLHYVDNKDYSLAYHYFKKGCDLNHAAACAGLGQLYENGDGVYQDYAYAGELYKKSCDMPDADGASMGCHGLARLYYYPNTNRTDKATAERYYRKACNSDRLPMAEACDILRRYY